jgi:hypothetical protein
LLCAGIVILSLTGVGKESKVMAGMVTTTYEFIPGRSWVGESDWMGNSKLYAIDGQFQLNVDFDSGIAFFKQVNATISQNISFSDYYDGNTIYTNNLNTIFHMTELVSKNMSDGEIDFLFEKNIPNFPYYSNVHLTLTFLNGSIHLYGWFYEPIYDGPYFDLYANASVIPEPCSLLLLALGGLLIKRK